MLSPQKISSVIADERASSVSIFSPATSVAGSSLPTVKVPPSVSVRVTVYPAESATGAIITGMIFASSVQLSGCGRFTVIVRSEAVTEPSARSTRTLPAIASPPLAVTSAFVTE